MKFKNLEEYKAWFIAATQAEREAELPGCFSTLFLYSGLDLVLSVIAGVGSPERLLTILQNIYSRVGDWGRLAFPISELIKRNKNQDWGSSLTNPCFNEVAKIICRYGEEDAPLPYVSQQIKLRYNNDLRIARLYMSQSDLDAMISSFYITDVIENKNFKFAIELLEARSVQLRSTDIPFDALQKFFTIPDNTFNENHYRLFLLLFQSHYSLPGQLIDSLDEIINTAFKYNLFEGLKALLTCTITTKCNQGATYIQMERKFSHLLSTLTTTQPEKTKKFLDMHCDSVYLTLIQNNQGHFHLHKILSEYNKSIFLLFKPGNIEDRLTILDQALRHLPENSKLTDAEQKIYQTISRNIKSNTPYGLMSVAHLYCIKENIFTELICCAPELPTELYTLLYMDIEDATKLKIQSSAHNINIDVDVCFKIISSPDRIKYINTPTKDDVRPVFQQLYMMNNFLEHYYQLVIF